MKHLTNNVKRIGNPIQNHHLLLEALPNQRQGEIKTLVTFQMRWQLSSE